MRAGRFRDHARPKERIMDLKSINPESLKQTAPPANAANPESAMRLDLPIEDGRFALPPLPYPYEALEPALEAETMHFHHDAHHAAYVKKLNDALGDRAVQEPLESIFARITEFPAAVRGNGGGHWNHTFFWSCMAPEGP